METFLRLVSNIDTSLENATGSGLADGLSIPAWMRRAVVVGKYVQKTQRLERRLGRKARMPDFTSAFRTVSIESDLGKGSYQMCSSPALK